MPSPDLAERGLCDSNSDQAKDNIYSLESPVQSIEKMDRSDSVSESLYVSDVFEKHVNSATSKTDQLGECCTASSYTSVNIKSTQEQRNSLVDYCDTNDNLDIPNTISELVSKSEYGQNTPTEKMSRTNLYIKGLPDSFNDDKLWSLPPDQTQIKSVKAATDDDSKCRGYGFIDFVNEDAANTALQHIRDTYPAFTVKFAKENEKDKTNLYVTNLPKSWTTKDSDQLKLVFERFGPIQSAFVMMERSTNRATGVGFVRFANERDALDALESLKKEPIILPECTDPVEAKFADKHNPDTRRRRYPISSILATPNVNNIIGYPLNLSADSSLSSQDQLAALLNTGLPLHTPAAATSALAALHALQAKTDYTNRLAHGLLSNPISSNKIHSPAPMANLGLPNYSLPHASADPQLSALAAAASAILNATTPAGYVNGCMRPGNTCASNNVSSGLNGNLLPPNTLSLLGTTPVNPNDAGILDLGGLYGCSVYGTDYYRQPQQPQHLLAAAMAAMNSVNGTQTPLYQPIPELSPYVNYQTLLNCNQTPTVSTNCLVTNNSNLATMYAAQAGGLLGANSMLSSAQQLPDSITLPTPRQSNGFHQWIIPDQLMKQRSAEPMTLPQPNAAQSPNVNLATLDRNCKHVQLFI
ncbi:unnamed protein product [Calicophoron daubneyi]|uniref:RRM domain-containing protein n=1 Tax=Calicophoron daubneyi TaxID=300641 RepID=A0AAV2T976_CALDB